MKVDFLTQFFREANIHKMSDARALLALASFFKGFASSQYKVGSEMVSSKKHNKFSWPEGVQYFFRNHAQSSRFSLAIADLRAVIEGLMEIERGLATKFNRAICRCGNVDRPKVVLILYIITPRHTNYAVVAGYRASHHQATYLNVVDFSQHKKIQDEPHMSTSQEYGIGKPLQNLHPSHYLSPQEKTNLLQHLRSLTQRYWH